MSDGRIRWTRDGRPTHLVRNVCDACAVWCDADHYDDGACDEPADCTCLDCLKAAAAYGASAAERAKAIESDPPTFTPLPPKRGTPVTVASVEKILRDAFGDRSES